MMPGKNSVSINGKRLVLDEWHTRQLTALRSLAGELGRPVLRRELAAALDVAESDLSLAGLYRRGWLLYRKVGSETERGAWPRPVQKPALARAIRAFEALEDGLTYEWREPRRDRGRRFKRRSMTLTAADRSHIRGMIRDVVEYLGLTSVRQVEHHHLALIPEAVRTLSMERSLVPRSQWDAPTEASKRARRTASKRTSEMRRFLSWCEWQGYLSLAGIESDTLTPQWIRFAQAAGDDQRAMSDARMLASHAMRAGADRPERVVEIGFDRVEEEVRARESLSTERAVRTTLSRIRRAWDVVASRWETLPPWPRPAPRVGGRREDGGLENSWWSGRAFFRGRPSLLDDPDMELQRRQAQDLRDWWMLDDPTRREGAPLPPRPQHSRTGRRRLGARHPGESTAVRYLAAVSTFQRFVLTFDASEHRRPWRDGADAIPPYDHRLSEEELRDVSWSELLSDRDRLLRYVEWSFESDLAANEGVLYAGIRRLLALYTILWAYMPAADKLEIEAIKAKRLELDPTTEAGVASSKALDRAEAAAKHSIAAWEARADDVLTLYGRLEEAAGGVKKRGDRTEVRRVFSHQDARRCADWFRDQRLDREAVLREKTAKLIATRTRNRKRACAEDGCGTIGCDVHHPIPRLSARGIAIELFDRTFCVLANKELILRLPSILPWRPSTLRRARIGEHIHEDLSIAVVGLDGKIERQGGRIKRQEAAIPDLEFFDDPGEIEHLVEVLQVVMHETRVWLWANPTSTGTRIRDTQRADTLERWEQRLFVNSYGLPWEDQAAFAATMRGALEEAAAGINAALEDGDSSITLPAGYGGRGSYILRFLWGHRARQHGVSYADIAAALGNSERTVRRHYQDVQPNESLNHVARQVRKNRDRGAEPEPGPAEVPADPIERLAGYREDKARIEQEGACLGLSSDEIGSLLVDAKRRWGV